MSQKNRLVRVELGPRSYDIQIGAGTLAQSGPFLLARRKPSRVIVICDEHVRTSHAATVANSIAAAGPQVDTLVVEPGEGSKSLRVAERLWNDLAALKVDRQTVVVAVGGGVIGDLGGFVAATYARGLPLMHVPTTLLAQVDSAIGGKVAINLPQAKNIVGAIWQPLGVLADTTTLATLPDREYRAGLAEVVKYGVIMDPEFFQYLEDHAKELLARDAEVLEHAITRSCELKALVVQGDEREETGGRASLNYGHTFCHALETVTGYATWLHGEAVSIGMICASRLAERLGRIDPQVTERQCKLLAALKLPVDLPALDPGALVDAMTRDKKTEHGQLRFVLPSKLGHVDLVGAVDPAHVRAVLGG